jgi:hypothetical protein
MIVKIVEKSSSKKGYGNQNQVYSIMIFVVKRKTLCVFPYVEGNPWTFSFAWIRRLLFMTKRQK